MVELHPYELPEVVAVEVAGGLSAYLDWVARTSQLTDPTRRIPVPSATPEPMPSMAFLRRLLAPAGLLLAFVAPAQAVDEKDLLPVDEAFALSASATARGRIELHWKIAEGYYLYRHRIGVAGRCAVRSRSIRSSCRQGEKKTDEFFGEVETYRQR